MTKRDESLRQRQNTRLAWIVGGTAILFYVLGMLWL